MKLKRIDEVEVGDQFEIGTILVEVVGSRKNNKVQTLLLLEPIMKSFKKGSVITLVMANNYKMIIIAERPADDPEPN